MRVALFLLAFAGACSGCSNMKHQPNLRTGEAPPRQAPEHTVEHDAPSADPKPPVTLALLARGQSRFEAACSECHGSDGYGRGIVVRRGFPPPPSLHEARLRALPDAEILRVIERGYGIMYPASDRVPVEDRWAVVEYIRALQRSQHATLADVPAAEREALSRP